jgi:hypothetical protein
MRKVDEWGEDIYCGKLLISKQRDSGMLTVTKYIRGSQSCRFYPDSYHDSRQGFLVAESCER